MINLKNYDIKYISAAVFGILSLIISIIAGLFSGNGISVILFRTLITVIIFAIIGMSCAIVISKYVPEIYHVFSSMDGAEAEIKGEDVMSDAESNPAGGIAGSEASSPAADISPDMHREDKELESEFNTFDRRPDGLSGLGDEISGGKGALKDNKVVYEPKIAAQAIRTMLKKDE